MQKGLTSHYILTSKNKNNAFKAKLTLLTKQKNEKYKKAQTRLIDYKGYFDYPITVTLQLVLSYKNTYL